MFVEYRRRRVRFADGILNGLDLPLLDVQALFNSPACQVRFGTIRRLGECGDTGLFSCCGETRPPIDCGLDHPLWGVCPIIHLS